LGNIKKILFDLIFGVLTSLSAIGFAPGFVNYKKGCTLLATASDKIYQLLAHGGSLRLLRLLPPLKLVAMI
jgi:hypothetical protein